MRVNESKMQGVYRKCQCPLFKQFTTDMLGMDYMLRVFIVSVNVLFLSNSQHYLVDVTRYMGCLS